MNMHINEEVYSDRDVILLPNKVETVDASHKTTKKDFEKLMLVGPDIAVLGTGFRKRTAIDNSVLEMARKNNVELHVLPTAEAAKKFQELARKGKNVVAKLHITC